MESRMTIIKREEAVNRQLTAKEIVLPTEHLFANTSPNLSLEIKDGTKTKISSFAALIIFYVLNAPAAPEGGHTGEDIFIEMKSFLRFGDSSAGIHESGINEIRMAIVKLSAYPSQRSSREGAESLFFSSRDITQDTNILRKDVFACPENSHGCLGKFLLTPLCIRILLRHSIRFKLAQHITNLEALLEVVVLVGIDELQILTPIEDNCMVLVVRLAIT